MRGAFGFAVRAQTAGSSRYRVVAGNTQHPAATSRMLRIVIRAKSKPIATPVAPTSVGGVIGTTVLPFGTLGVLYKVKLSTIDGRAGTWSIASGVLPPGLLLEPSGELAGIPAANGSSRFVVAFTDIANVRATQSLSLEVQPPPGVTQLSAGGASVCALRVDGTVACWGDNSGGQLGNVNVATLLRPYTPEQVSGLADATAVSVGGIHACAIRVGGSMVCWGNNGNGALGDGTGKARLAPVAVLGVTDAVAVSSGDNYTCALHRSGTVSCWGLNGNQGTLGDGTYTDSWTPTVVVGITDATAISSGHSHACALRATGTVSCWGYSFYGALGAEATLGSSVPLTVAGLTDAVAISAGADYTCAIRATGSVVCWGRGSGGALRDSSALLPVSGLADAVAISASDGACALRASGTIVCWGNNTSGQLGDGTTTSSPTPVPVNGLTNVTAIGVGGAFACALVTGRIVCWGSNESGQLGMQGGPAQIALAPTLVNGV